MATNYMYCVTVDLSAINYTKGKMSYLNVNEKFICFESVYVLGRCGLNLSQFANDSSAVLLACDRDEKRLRTRQWPAAMSVGSNVRGSKWCQNGRK